jgi:hypothetical protein
MPVVHDLANPTPPDMTRAQPGCFAILGGTNSTNAKSKMLAQAFLTCADNICGNPQIMDGGTGLPCSMLVDGGGVSASCDRCFANVQVNDQISFTDPNTMMAVVCEDVNTGTPDTGAMGCKACANEIVACVLDCNSDKDCMGLTDSSGNTATCMAGNQCGF